MITTHTLVFLILIFLLIGAVPAWPHSRSWGYYPSSFSGAVLVILIAAALPGAI